MKFNDVLPEGSEYITLGKKVFHAGERFPETDLFDEFHYGDYVYVFSKKVGKTWTWSVNVKNQQKTSYGEILESINNIPVSYIGYAFQNCKNLIETPKIPDSIMNMDYAFAGCESLIKINNLPNNITSLYQTFSNCTSLIEVPKIPNSVTSMVETFFNCRSLVKINGLSNGLINLFGAFGNCASLTTAPEIPDSVIDMNQSFYDCKSLMGDITIPKYTVDLRFAFKGCVSLNTITFENSNQDITNIFNNDTTVKIKGLSKEAEIQAKRICPNIRVRTEKQSKLSEFLESDEPQK